MNKGWIKLYRKFLDWEWIQEPNVVHLFVHLLLRVNYEEKKWRGITIKKGQIVTGLYSLQEMTGLSIRSIRTALEKLESTGEITRKTTNRFSIITVINWAKYQEDKKYRQTNDKQTTTTKEYKESKEDIIAKAIEEKLPVNKNKMYNYIPIDDDGNEGTISPRGKFRLKKTAEFSWDEQVEKMKNSPLRIHQTIVLYWLIKKWSFDSWDKFDPALLRETRPAKSLKGYELSEIKKGMKYCIDKFQDNWTLETVGKWMPEALKTKKEILL